jgi:hypothetical protein
VLYLSKSLVSEPEFEPPKELHIEDLAMDGKAYAHR